MTHEPINPDDPQMTAYALGELSVAEAAEFEALLQHSPKAAEELASMGEIMDLLSVGLKKEWENELKHPTLTLLEPVNAESLRSDKSVIVVGQFRPAKRHISAVAAAAAILVAGSAWVMSHRTASVDSIDVAQMESINENISPDGFHVPQLILAEEVDDLSALDLADGRSLFEKGVDASYLEAASSIPASFTPGQSNSASFSPERVDSYLPTYGGFSDLQGIKTGMIERRLGRGGDHKIDNSDSVVVRGYVTMGTSAPLSSAKVLSGFRPVSISGNPVVNEENDLRLLADLNGLQKELSDIIAEMPKDSAERADLERILVRSQRVVSQLKRELAH